jgi:hypothetical protein
MWGEEKYPHTGPLLTRSAIKEESPMGSGEDRSSGLWLTDVRAPWVACWRHPADYEVGQHLALAAWHDAKSSSNSANSTAHLAILSVTLGLWSTALSGYEDTTKLL